MLSKLVNHLIPSSCLLCEMENPQLICPGCSEQFFSSMHSRPHRCVSCALPTLTHDTHCAACLKKPPAFDSTTVACDYVAPFDQLVLALKFGHRLAVAKAIADLLSKVVGPPIPDLFIAVPLGHQRLAQRGFNQALEIAKPLAQALNRPLYSNLMHRVRDTQAQALLSPDQRQKNILQAFSLNQSDADKIHGRHIGVVDDVITTGATLHEVASCLKKYGAARVSNIVFARTI
jgi:ComF family protein